MHIENGSWEAFKPEIRCKVCGHTLYSTDWGNHQITYHCSSPEARFWDFHRGTPDQHKAKEHWDLSKEEIFFNEDLHATC
jgi:hypothetical protein